MFNLVVFQKETLRVWIVVKIKLSQRLELIIILTKMRFVLKRKNLCKLVSKKVNEPTSSSALKKQSSQV